MRGPRLTPPAYSGTDVQLFDDPDAFLQEAAGYLADDPFSASVIAVYASRVRSGSQPQGPDDLWATVTGSGHLWVDGSTPVAMAAHSAPAGGVARVGSVYTPPRMRRHGFGSAVTAAALGAGSVHVVPYTDLSNATSNAIYQAIGYRPDHDAEERSFVSADLTANR